VAGLRLAAKHFLFQQVRGFHLRWYRKEALPDRVAVYMHSVEPSQHDALRSLIGWLRESSYQFVSPAVFTTPGAGRRAFLSFDDNYRTWLDLLPLLEEERVSATFYVNAGPLRDRASEAAVSAYFDRICHNGDRVSLTSGEVCDIAATGHVIGSHTLSHPMLTRIRSHEARDEIRHGKEALEEILGRAVPDFSYPFGMRRHFNEELRSFCSEIGIRTVASARPIPHALHQPLSIHRILWRLDRPFRDNADNLHVDGQLFERLTGRSPVGD
jgi:peptidoglycan/xylan/chitin deacetylase (PgdA/CDA1 family)